MIDRFAVQEAFGWNRGGSAFCNAYTSPARSVSGVPGVISGTVPAEPTRLVMMPFG